MSAEQRHGEQWEPSNGTEGAYFIEGWCANCERDKVMNGDATDEDADKDPSIYCQILSDSFIRAVPEWREIDGEPKCLKFVKKGDALPDRCPHTQELPL
jgi:hypothetical protein